MYLQTSFFIHFSFNFLIITGSLLTQVVRQRESKLKPSHVTTSDEREGGERGEEEEGGGGDGGGGRGWPRPYTPPPKEEAFEQFKKERGSEINKILLSNKGQWVQFYADLPVIGVHKMHG